jgi:galactonate dehydratase
MRIERLQAHAVGVTPKTNWVFVTLATEDGITGVGEASLNGWEPLLLAYAERLARTVEGQDTDALARHTRYLPHAPGGLVVHAIRSALEQAAVDNAAQRAGMPVHEVLGGARRTRVPVYANINRATADRSPSGFGASARAAVAAGFRAVKVAPFDGAIAEDRHVTPYRERVHAGIERVLAVRDAVGPGVAVMADCHWRLDEPTASEVIHALAPARLHWLECPVSEQRGQLDAIARLRALANANGIRLAGAETVAGADAVAPFLERGCYDVIMPDLKYCGGYRGMLEIGAAAAAAGVALSPHNPTGPVCNLGSLHACAALSECLSLEYQLAESPLYTTLVHGVAPALVDGCFEVPRTPGVGASLDLGVVAAHPWQALPPGANLDERLG